VDGDRTKAKELLYRAIGERPNFLEALSFLTQLELEDRNPGKAIEVIRNGVAAEPTNFLLRFALGYLYYANRQFPEALIEFESAVFLNPVYADAKYFLGLTYAELNRRADAITQFEGVLELNPDNTDVKRILQNLRANRAPFSGGITEPTEPVTDALESLQEGK
jgi:tetratricopeptide (TPR) repeat protein